MTILNMEQQIILVASLIIMTLTGFIAGYVYGKSKKDANVLEDER